MITNQSEFPTYDSMFMNVLKTYNKNWGTMDRSEIAREVYKEYYSDYSLDVLAGKSNKPLIYDRIHWALYTLFAGRYLDRPMRGEYQISEKWRKFLKTWKELTYKYLITDDEDYKNSSFHIWKKAFSNSNNQWVNNNASEMSPQDMFQLWFEQLEAPKKDELLEKLMEMDPFVFEKVVWTLCEAMWYWTFLETPKSHDWWIDWVIKWDSLWFEKIYIQAKRYWDGNLVNWKEMQNFVWALALTSVKRWIFFTTSSFADNARKTAEKASTSGQEIILIDGRMLVDLMFKYNVWVQTKEVYEIKNIDEDFFSWFN